MSIKTMSWLRFRWWKLVLFILLLLLCGLIWIVGTQSGSRWVLKTAVGQLDGEIGEVQGSIWSGLEVDQLHLDLPTVKIHSTDLALKVDWSYLLKAQLNVKKLALNELDIELFPGTETTEESEPFTELNIPLQIQIEQIKLDQFKLHNEQGDILPFAVQNLDVSEIILGRDQASLVLNHIQLDNEDFSTQLKGLAKVKELKAPWPLTLDLEAKNLGHHSQSFFCVNTLLGKSLDKRIASQCPFDLDLQAQGDINNLKVQLSGAGQDSTVDLTTHLNLGKALVLESLLVNVNLQQKTHLDLDLKTEEQGPDTRLYGTIETDHLVLDALMADSYLSAQLNLEGLVSENLNPKTLKLKGDIKPSQWNQQNLTGDLDFSLNFEKVFAKQEKGKTEKDEAAQTLAWENILIDQADLLIKLGENQIKTKGHIQQKEEDQLAIQLVAPELQQVWPDLKGSAGGDLLLRGNAKQHELNAQFSFDPGKAQDKIGQAPIYADLELKGALDKNAQGYAWHGSLNDLNLNHADLKLNQEQKLKIAFNQAATGKEALLAIDQGDFELLMPGNHKAKIQHERTAVDLGGWTSQGQIDKLTFSEKLLEDLDLQLVQNPAKEKTKPVSYDLDWQVAKSPELSARVNLERTSGTALFPQAESLPLDFKHLKLNLREEYQKDQQLFLITATAEGENSALDADLKIDPSLVVGLSQGNLNLELTDQSSLELTVKQDKKSGKNGADYWQSRLLTKHLKLDQLTLNALPQSDLNSEIILNANILDQKELKDLLLELNFDESSQWNHELLQGSLSTFIDLANVLPLPSVLGSEGPKIQTNFDNLKLKDTEIDLQIGDNYLKGDGSWGDQDNQLALNFIFPKLKQLWPNLEGSLQSHLELTGSTLDHQVVVHALYDHLRENYASKTPLNLNLSLEGQADLRMHQAWQGHINDLNLALAHTKLALEKPGALRFALNSANDDEPINWEVSDLLLNLSYPDGREAKINHLGSAGQGAQWRSQGEIDNLILSMSLYDYLLSIQDSFAKNSQINLPKKVKAEEEMVLNGDWRFLNDKRLAGELHLKRLNAEGQWPFPTPVPLDFNELSFELDQYALKKDESESTAEAQQEVTEEKDGSSKTQEEKQGSALKTVPDQVLGYLIQAKGSGPQSTLKGNIKINPESLVFIDDAELFLKLPDKSMLQTRISVSPDSSLKTDAEQIEVAGHLITSGLPLDKISYGAVPPGQIQANLFFDTHLSREDGLRSAHLYGLFDKGSRWNKQPLTGQLNLELLQKKPQELSTTEDYRLQRLANAFYIIPKADIDLSLGQNKITTKGNFGEADDELDININAPRLADFWPELPGALTLTSQVKGALDNNEIALKTKFTQGNSQVVGKAPVSLDVLIKGGWLELFKGTSGFAGTLEHIRLEHAQFKVNQNTPASFAFSPQGPQGAPLWNLGASTIDLSLPGNHIIKIKQQGTSGREGKWDTKGAIDGIVLSRPVIQDLLEAFGKESQESVKNIIVKTAKKRDIPDPIFDFDWQFSFDQALKGEAKLAHRSGDFAIPAQVPFPLGLNQLLLRVKAQPQSGERSLVTMDFDLDTSERGQFSGEAKTQFAGLNPELESTVAKVKGHLDDISWLSIFSNDLVELGGAVTADVEVTNRNGKWVNQGQVKGKDLKIIEIENGIRFLEGRLDLRLQGDEVIIDELHFPAVIRVMPTERRTREWIEKTPAAQQGSFDITGRWNLQQMGGKVKVALDHYPIMQRSDRFAMISGEVNVDAALPALIVKGQVKADAGWASVDLEGTPPSVDGDVVVLKKGQTKEDLEKQRTESQSSLDLNLDFNVDLGERFFVVGLGLDAQVVGSLNVLQEKGRLSGKGEFRTRRGTIDAYGQHLQIRRGSIAFNGDLTNPVLNIEAIRNGLDVEAGVRVVGTAHKPKITLVSYPETSEIEKLSWLIMGRGPDSSGADLSMLLSVGSSLVGGNSEPFYREFGIDDVAIRSGDVGKTGSVLPKKTNADSRAYTGDYDLESQYLEISKTFKQGLTGSIEQALTGSGTVGRLSYRLMRFLTADVKVGTINGIELVYRRFFRD